MTSLIRPLISLCLALLLIGPGAAAELLESKEREPSDLGGELVKIASARGVLFRSFKQPWTLLTHQEEPLAEGESFRRLMPLPLGKHFLTLRRVRGKLSPVLQLHRLDGAMPELVSESAESRFGDGDRAAGTEDGGGALLAGHFDMVHSLRLRGDKILGCESYCGRTMEDEGWDPKELPFPVHILPIKRLGRINQMQVHPNGKWVYLKLLDRGPPLRRLDRDPATGALTLGEATEFPKADVPIADAGGVALPLSLVNLRNMLIASDGSHLFLRSFAGGKCYVVVYQIAADGGLTHVQTLTPDLKHWQAECALAPDGGLFVAGGRAIVRYHLDGATLVASDIKRWDNDEELRGLRQLLFDPDDLCLWYSSEKYFYRRIDVKAAK